MRLTNSRPSLRDVRKTTYAFVNKIKDLHRGKKLERIYGRRSLDGHAFATLSIQNSRALLDLSFRSLSDPEIVAKRDRLLLRLDELAHELTRADQHKRVLPKGATAAPLSAHTDFFRSLRATHPTARLPELDSTFIESWLKTVTAAVAVWQDGFRLR